MLDHPLDVAALTDSVDALVGVRAGIAVCVEQLVDAALVVPSPRPDSGSVE